MKTAQNNKNVTFSGMLNCFFLLFYECGWQGVVLKVIKNDHFLVFLAIFVLFLKFLGRLSGDLC